MIWTELRNQAAFATGNFVKLFGKMEIPPLPQVALRLMQLSRQPDVEISDVAKLVASDTGISAKIMTTVNSAYVGLPHKIADIHHAVTMLGLKRIHSLVLSYSAVKTLPRTGRGFNPQAFWQASLQRAVFAEMLAKDFFGGQEGEAFTGALLQDMAMPVLLNQWAEYYLPVVTRAEKSGQALFEVEEAEFSWNHAQAGAWMARNWGFPDVLVCCVGLHHAGPERLRSLNLADTPVMAVAAAARLPDAESLCRSAFDMDAGHYEQLCLRTDEASEEVARLFDVPKPEPLVGPRQDDGATDAAG